MRHVPSRKAAEILGMHPNTLRKYADNGLIPHFRNPAGQRLYDVETYLERFQPASVVCYCRVSSNDQRDDLERQARWMRERYPDGEIVKDVGGEKSTRPTRPKVFSCPFNLLSHALSVKGRAPHQKTLALGRVRSRHYIRTPTPCSAHRRCRALFRGGVRWDINSPSSLRRSLV